MILIFSIHRVLRRRVFLEEWLRRIPDFKLDPDRPPVMTSSMMNMMTELPLVWDA